MEPIEAKPSVNSELIRICGLHGITPSVLSRAWIPSTGGKSLLPFATVKKYFLSTHNHQPKTGHAVLMLELINAVAASQGCSRKYTIQDLYPVSLFLPPTCPNMDLFSLSVKVRAVRLRRTR